MKFYFENVALHELGTVIFRGQQESFEPPELPQAKRVTLRLALAFHEQSWTENAGLVDSLRSALARGTGLFVWVDDTEVTVVSRTAALSGLDLSYPDELGTYAQAVEFTATWSEALPTAPAQGATYQRDGAAAVSLGTVTRWRERYQSERFAPHKDPVSRLPGSIAAGGWILADSRLSVSAQQAALEAAVAAMREELRLGATGTLTHGGFSRVVRVDDFDAEVDQAHGRVAWSMGASYTLFPNESDFAAVDYRLTRGENYASGNVTLQFAGRIDASSEATARAKLASLRTAVVGVEWARQQSDSDARTVDGGLSGVSFVELGFNESYKLADEGITEWTLKVTDADSLKSGLIRTTYSGTVTAHAATEAAALAAAVAKAAALGSGRYPMLEQSTVTQNSSQRLATGDAEVSVEFSYEYQRKGARTYLEVETRATHESFGASAESVSGFVVAPTLALARAAYAATVKSAWTGRALLNEETRDAKQIVGGGTTQEIRLDFAFTVHRARVAAERAITYSVSVDKDFQSNEQRVQLSGSAWAESEAAAGALIDATVAAVAPAGSRRLRQTRRSEWQRGPDVARGAMVAAQVMKLDFSEEYSAVLAGEASVLECELSEEVQYAGVRWIEQPLPDRESLMQPCGIAAGRREVRGSVQATSESVARAWAVARGPSLLTGPYQHPPRIDTAWAFAPGVDGVPRGATMNPKIIRCTFSFTETLPSLTFTSS